MLGLTGVLLELVRPGQLAFGIVPPSFGSFFVKAWSGNLGINCCSILFLSVKNLLEGFLLLMDLVIELLRTKKTGDALRDSCALLGGSDKGVLLLAPMLLRIEHRFSLVS